MMLRRLSRWALLFGCSMAAAATQPADGQSRSAPPPRPALYAVVIGIDAYTGVKPLEGAVNDATVIAAALKSDGAREIVMLLDHDATRARILSEVARMGARAAADSGMLIITYAGHGSQEPERLPGDEADGLDEVLVLAGFHAHGAGTAERIVDNDIYAMLSAIPTSVPIVLVVDACHSGTITRSADPRGAALRTRVATYGAITDDELPPPLPATRGKEADALPNVIAVSSALDSEVTPEVIIDGKPHGAVSWFFARALRGDADADKDGVTTLAEFRQFIVNGARLAAESRQTPGVQFLAGRSAEPFPSAATSAPTAFSRPTEPIAAQLRLWINGNGVIPKGAVAASAKDAADLIWDVARHEVVANATADVIAEQNPDQGAAAFIAGVVDKWQTLPQLRELATAEPLPLTIAPKGAGARYRDGKVTIEVGLPPSSRLRYLTIIDLAGDGTVQPLFPRRGRYEDEGPLAPNRSITIDTRVQRPFGADHVVAILTAEPPDVLRKSLESLYGRQSSGEAIDTIKRTLGAGKVGYAIGLTSLYTGE